MKFIIKITILLFCVSIAVSCSIENRLYNSGYSIDYYKSSKQHQVGNSKKPKQTTTITKSNDTKKLEIAKQKDSILPQSLTASNNSKTYIVATKRHSLDIAPQIANKEIEQPKQKTLEHKIITESSYNSDDETSTPIESDKTKQSKKFLTLAIVALILAMLISVTYSEIALILAALSFILMLMHFRDNAETKKLNKEKTITESPGIQQIPKKSAPKVGQDSIQLPNASTPQTLEKDRNQQFKDLQPENRKFNINSVVAFITSILGIFTMPLGSISLVLLLTSLITGIVALWQLKNKPEKGTRGLWLAILSLILPVFVLALLVALLLLFLFLFGI